MEPLDIDLGNLAEKAKKEWKRMAFSIFFGGLGGLVGNNFFPGKPLMVLLYTFAGGKVGDEIYKLTEESEQK